MGVSQDQGRDYLTMINAETALDLYEAARHRLPRVNYKGDCVPLSDLMELADRYDILLFDAFGVLNIGEEAIPGVPKRILELQAAGKRVMVLTNSASMPHSALLEKFTRQGYHFAPEDVISSRDVLLAHFAPAVGECWGVIVPPELQKGTLDDFPLTFLEDDPVDYKAVNGVLMLGSGGWTAKRQALLNEALCRQPRPLWVGNPDIVAPRESGFSAQPGYFAHHLADRSSIVPRFFGKPFRNIYHYAFSRMGSEFDPKRTVMIGDSLHTDILGAQASGIDSALVVNHGLLAELCATDEICRTAIKPDFILTGL
ncbi:MAG: HAD hydrolase-like protein [Gammaproteobacteria bacterium]|nr:HAD hydrolase-like protein [Gammaproteobacteria bacterium]MCP4878902.1 HAD hydrolase-like protein [Gammaproteobacteria bacterium]